MEYFGHQLRHELKYYINGGVYHTLCTRFSIVAAPDSHMTNSKGCLAACLYFDNVHHSAISASPASRMTPT